MIKLYYLTAPDVAYCMTKYKLTITKYHKDKWLRLIHAQKSQTLDR